jgi:uncharacterized membrane protein
MIKIVRSVVINCPAETVLAFLKNPANDQRWQSWLLEFEQLSEGPVDVGTRFRQDLLLVGRRIEQVVEITEHRLDRRICFKVISGPLPLRGCRRVEVVQKGTKVTFTLEGRAKGFPVFMGPVINRAAKKQVKADLRRLKRILEA